MQLVSSIDCPLSSRAASVTVDTVWTDRFITAFVADASMLRTAVPIVRDVPLYLKKSVDGIDAADVVTEFMKLDPCDVQGLADFQSRYGLITSPHRAYGTNQDNDGNGAFENIDPRLNLVMASNAVSDELLDSWAYVAAVHNMLDVPEYIDIPDPDIFLARRSVSLSEAASTVTRLQRLFRLSSGICEDGETPEDAEAAKEHLVREANIAIRNALDPFILFDGECERYAPITTIMLRHMVALMYRGRRMRRCAKCGNLYPERMEGRVSKYCSTYCQETSSNHPKNENGIRRDSIRRSEKRKAEKARKQKDNTPPVAAE